VQHNENFFLALRDDTSTVYDPNTLAVPGSMPSFFPLLDLTDYNHTNGYQFFPPPPPWMAQSLPSGAGSFLPPLCTLSGTNTFADERFELVLGTYGAGDATRAGYYRKILDRVLCLSFAYVRQPHPYERCQSCFADNGGTMEVVKRPGPPGTNCLPPVFPDVLSPLPVAHFATQQPLLSADQTNQGLVFMPFPTGGIGQPLDILIMSDTYSTHLIKVALIIEDDKIWRVNDSASPGDQWTNPLTGRPFRTLRVDIDYYIPTNNKPCDVGLGACNFNNSQCTR
jgi:hypothetical protein